MNCTDCMSRKGYCPKDCKKTNADRIRAMTDEELAKFFFVTEPLWCTHIDTCGADDDCRTCLLEWLKQEVKE